MEWFKDLWKELAILVYWVFSYLHLSVEVTLVIVILMSIDTIFGVAKSYALKKKVKFKILFAGLIGKITILIIPFVLALVAKHVAPRYDFTHLIDLVLDLMLVSEGLSIITNTISIRTKKEIKNFDIITKMLKALRTFFIKYISGVLKKIGEEDSKEEEDSDTPELN